jgi:L-malate glycosyltransferase
MLSRPKVAFISHSYVESACRRKLVHLSEATDLQLITPSSYPTPYGWYNLDFEFNTGLDILSFPIQFFHTKRTSTRWFLRSTDLGFSQFKPDIIHIENELHSWIVCQALFCRKWRAPQAKVVVFSWENLPLQGQGLKARGLEYLARLNRQFVDFFLCGNVAGKEILVAKGVPAERISIVPQFGVDPDAFHPSRPELTKSSRRDLGISQQAFVIGFVGRFTQEKGLLDLVEAAGRLSKVLPREVVLLLTGKGGLEEQVRRRCAQFSPKLIVLAPRKYHQIAEVMNILDVLVLPSQSRSFWKEQFGRVLIEAMACGTPVIGSDSGEIPNVIGDAGLIFRECEHEELFMCLHLCGENETFRLMLRERGLARVLNSFTNQKIAQQTLEIYDRLAVANPANDRVPQYV